MRPNFKNTPNAATLLVNAGLAVNDVNLWIGALPTLRGDFAYDSSVCSAYWNLGKRLRGQLSKKRPRNPNETTANEYIHQRERELREHFLDAHIEKLYDKLTNRGSKFLRVEELVTEAAQIVPGLTPSAEALAGERRLLLKDKEGLEIDHGILLSRVLANPVSGRHLCHAMLLPRAETIGLLEHFAKHGLVDLGTATVSKVGKAAVVELRNPKTLNALDETTLAPLEVAIDLAILDKTTEIAILRGGRLNTQNIRGVAFSQPESTSRISIKERSRSCSTFNMQWVMNTKCFVALRAMMLRLTTWLDPPPKSLGSLWSRPLRSVAGASICW